MTQPPRSRVEELFSATLGQPAANRDEFLRAACADDPRLYFELRSLIAADESGDDILDRSAAGAILESLERSLLGRTIGPYRVASLLSTGPMGWVLRAERSDGQFERTVVLKVYPAIGDPQERRRFLEERQILASLEDRHIAHLYEGGCTEEGWPWFAMEEVRGTRITTWCEQQGLSLRARLKLFVEVCRAVEIAHRRLIIHCDLKPDNILVDETGQVRLLDFGIARLLQTESGPTEGESSRYLTTDYASPEQLRGEALGTATDAFALGAILYELLTGTTPFLCASLDIDKLLSVRQDELECASDRAARVDTAPVAPRRIRGDLDFIVARGLDSDPESRLASAAELADEVERHLDFRPLRGRQKERPYAFGRVLRRHRLVVVATILVLVAGVVIGSHGFRQARALAQRSADLQNERNRAKRATELLTEMFELADPYSTNTTAGDTLRVVDFLHRNRGRMLRDSADSPPLRAEVTLLLGKLYGNLGRVDDALALVDESVTIQRGLDPPEVATLAEAVHELGEIQKRRGEYDAARLAFRESLTLRRSLDVVPDEAIAQSLTGLAMILSRADSLTTAIQLDREALRLRLAAPEPDELKIAESLNNLGADSYFLERDQESIDYYDRALQIRVRELGSGHPLVADTRSNLARVYSELGQSEKARNYYIQALEGWRKALGPDHSQCAIATFNLARMAREAGEREEAIRWLTETLRIVETSLPPTHHWRAAIESQLAELTNGGEAPSTHP